MAVQIAQETAAQMAASFQPPEISTATIWAFTQPGMLMLCVIVAGMSTVGINMVSTIIALKTVMQEQHITTQPPTRSLWKAAIDIRWTSPVTNR